MARVLLGCTGWSYPDWVGPFYAPGTPPSDWLEAYARAFTFTEVDSSFYAAPSRERTLAWARKTPKGFVFSLKMPRAITHDAKLRGSEDAVGRFLADLAPLRTEGKLGPIVAQMPPRFRFEKDADALASFLAAWPRDQAFAVELRDASWWREETYAMLRDAGATLVWSTNETGRTPPIRTGDDVYVRLVGDRALDDAGGKWTHVQRKQQEELAYWRGVLQGLRDDLFTTFIVANNHFMGFAPETTRVVAELLGTPKPDIARAGRTEKQRGLGEFG